MREHVQEVRRRAAVLLLTVAAAVGVQVCPGAVAAGSGSPWVWPLAGPHVVGRPFQPPASRYGPGHRGADLPGAPGAIVRAAGAGRISYAGLLAGRGVVVVVHGELRTTYEPVTASVRVGQLVEAGAVIGRLTAGHAGCPATCLHWGLLRGDVYLDPVQLVTRGPSRLLPLDRPPLGGAEVRAGPAPVAAAAAGRAPAAAGAHARRAPAAAPPSPAAGPRPAGEPSFALRSADAAWGTAALVALMAGLVLLRRPGPPPRGPLAPALAATTPVGVSADSPQTADLVDLATERSRRRAAAGPGPA